MAHKFRVGSKVRVRTDLVVGYSYEEGWVFTREMAGLMGKVVTIERLERLNSYRINEDHGHCGWSVDMFEPVDSKALRAEKKTFKELLKSAIKRHIKTHDSDYISIETLQKMVDKVSATLERANKTKK